MTAELRYFECVRDDSISSLISLGRQRLSGFAETLPQDSHEYFICDSILSHIHSSGMPQKLSSGPSFVALQRLRAFSSCTPQFWQVYDMVILLFP
jgi:hypothetical protein